MSSAENPSQHPGVVIVGVPPSSAATIAAYRDRGFLVATAGVPASGDADTGLAAVVTAIDSLKALPEWNGKVAVAGYGLGGRYAYLAITRLGADAAVIFHGRDIGQHLREAQFARKPMSLHFGDDDEYVPFAEVRAVKGALEGIGTIEIYRYPGAGSGFALAGDPGYDAVAAADAERRAFAVLADLR